jgi:phage shock protein A
MSILNKLFTALRGGVREAGESVVDANALRIYEQELKDAETNLHRAKHNLTEVMAKRMQAARKVDEAKRGISEHEGFAAQALEKGNEGLALEIAEKITQLEQELKEQEQILATFEGHVTRLKDNVRQAERQLADHQRQLSMVKTTENVQKATMAISENFSASNSRMLTAKESLGRIRQRQQDREDRMKAAQELSDEGSSEGLKAKLQAAGIGEQAASAQSVLDRIKNKSSAR